MDSEDYSMIRKLKGKKYRPFVKAKRREEKHDKKVKRYKRKGG